jgi:carboxynorspermidine decarboxylase
MFETIPTPAYVVEEEKLKENLRILQDVETRSGCHILLAQKAFSMYAVYPLIGQYLSGTTASGLYEARLGHEEMGKENHVFAPAYKPEHMQELVKICDHIIFNSVAQYERYRGMCEGVSVGLRVNPMYSTQGDHAIYDPCAPGSRLGVTREQLPSALPWGEGGVEGLHFHTLCEQNFADLETTFAAVEEQFGEILPQVKWINMGGGHHITRADYDREGLIAFVRKVRETYDVEVYLEPGEAVALDAGYLVTEVMDIVHNDLDILILDASAACHMPDVLEMPYRPPLRGGYEPGEKPYTYRLSSLTCLAGDVIGDYSFDHPVQIGDRLVFEDMAIYSMVKNNTFNGIPLPDICLRKADGSIETVKRFSYEDFKGRL